MVLELVGGASLKVAVTELLKAVIDAKKKTTNFPQALTRLESTLRSVIPRVKQISRLNNKLKLPDEEIKELINILQDGQELVNKCSKVSSINMVRKVQYSKQLLDLDYSLLRYFQTILPLDHYRDTKEMLVILRELQKELVGAKDEGESSNPMEDEDSDIQSCQDPEEKETMQPVTEIEGIKANWWKDFWKFREKETVKNLVPEEIEEIKVNDQGKNLVPETVKNLVPEEIEEIKVNDQGKFRLKGCMYNFNLKDREFYDTEFGGIKDTEKRRYDITDCEWKTRHGKVTVIRFEKIVEKNESEHQMKIMAKVGNHPNIVPPIGYCFHENHGTLLFYDNFPQGSLYSRFHEYMGSPLWSYEYPGVRAPGLEWNTKLKVSLGVARGISPLHSVKFIHGNLNSSNVLLTSDLDACISTYGLLNFSSATQKSDVHSFGLLLLEILSGKNPTEENDQLWGDDRSDWVMKTFNGIGYGGPYNEEKHKMLRIAERCVNGDPHKRPKMKDVVEMLQNIRPSR